MAIYNQIYLSIDGLKLAENTTIETSLDADIQDVMTIVDGWKGITPAPTTRTVTASNVVPLTGAEYPFEQAMKENWEVELLLEEGNTGKKCMTRGYITNVPRSAGVGQTTTINFTFKGFPSLFE